MAIDTKLETIKNGVSGVRNAIKTIDSTLGNGTIDTLGDDIRTLNTRKYIWKWVNDNGVYEIEKETNNTDNIASGKYSMNKDIIAIILPDNIKTLNSASFENTSNLKYINLNYVNSIKNGAFSESGIILDINSFRGEEIGSYGFLKAPITGILANPNLSSIGTGAFNFTNIVEVQDLGVITSIPTTAFSSCGLLTFVKLPPTVTSIGNSVFEGCRKLKTVVVLALSPPELLNAYVFNGCTALTTIYVPYSADHSILASYQNATNWNTHASKMIELNEDGSIPS